MKLNNHLLFRSGVTPLILLLALLAGCSSAPPVRTQAYAKLSNQRTYETDFPTVWRATLNSLENYKILKQKPEQTDPASLKNVKTGSLETDWIYGQSRDKYQEYVINGSPRKIDLPARFKYEIEAKSILGGTVVTIQTQEEIEKVNADGSPGSYSSSGDPDPSRASELLDKIQVNMHSAR